MKYNEESTKHKQNSKEDEQFPGTLSLYVSI